MANSIHLAVCAFFSILLSFEIAYGHPISPEDVESLLPATPKTKNETVAAIVEDPVIQEAVQSFVGDGTLSGLVVKKNTVILPADKPDVIISQNEQILTAPLSHLEDIRKNITETAATASANDNSEVTNVEEISLAEIVPVNEKAPENLPETLIAQSLALDKEGSSALSVSEISADKLPPVSEITVGEKLKVPGILQSEIKLPEGVFPKNISLPSVIDDQISKPVVAVVGFKNGSGIEETVISLLPAAAESSSGINLDENSLGNWNLDKTNEKIPEYGARIPVAVRTSEEPDHPAVKIEARTSPEKKAVKNLMAVFIAPKDENSYYQSDENDMVAAEDIIFRPLFRYRQQQNDRLRLLENRAYQRVDYNRYNSGKYSYKKSQRTRYYNDYY